MRRPVVFLLLAAICLLLHSRNYHHSFLLDSTYGLTDNQAVRSLANIPSYFTDPSTLTSLRQNWEYRPVLQISYAINYWISGYSMWSWHLTQIALHALCALGLFSFNMRLLAIFRPGEDQGFHWRVSLLAALFFAIHPATSGVVNYQWARSSLLVAVLVLPSLSLYMRGGFGLPWIMACCLYGLALFTKVEAVAALGVYALFEVVCPRPHGTDSSRGFLRDLVQALNRRSLLRLAPFLALTLIYAVIRNIVIDDFIVEARQAVGMGQYTYLCTQLTAWWHYVARWFAPVRLVADDLSYPVFNSLLAPEVLLALAGWSMVGVLLAGLYRQRREYLFLVVAALALISPTSSFMPLAEMVNEHRPYLPLAVLSLAWITPLHRGLEGMVREHGLPRGLVTGAILLVLAAFFTLCWERNKVYQNVEVYWADVVAKAPSSRSYMNYGLELRHQGHDQEALDLFLKALPLAPRYHFLHVNLAISYERMGDLDKAGYHYDCAVRDEMYGSRALGYRADFHLRNRRYSQAAEDLEKALELSSDPYATRRDLAIARAGMGDWRAAAEATRLLCAEDPAHCEPDTIEIGRPFWNSPEGHAAGIEYYRALDAFLPRRWYVYANIADLAARLGRDQEAVAARAETKRLKPGK